MKTRSVLCNQKMSFDCLNVINRRLTNDDSEGVVFESDSISGRNGMSETDDTAEGSYSNRSKRFTVELSQDSLQKDSPSPNVVSIHREIQYMYIQMEFCEKSTLRYRTKYISVLNEFKLPMYIFKNIFSLGRLLMTTFMKILIEHGDYFAKLLRAWCTFISKE